MTTYGVICLRKRKGEWEVLMIARLVSYAYSDFVIHRYEWPQKNEEQQKVLQRMFNNMTARERGYISSLSYNHIWFLRWMSDPELNPQILHRSKTFFEKRDVFNKRFVCGNNREKIIAAMAASRNISQMDLYELPKGHGRDTETRLNSALREFEEETHLNRKHIKIIGADGQPIDDDAAGATSAPVGQPIRYDMTAADNLKLYTTYFYVAITDTPIQPSIKMNGTHPIEIADIKWVNVNDDMCKKYRDVLKSAVKRAVSAQSRLYDCADDCCQSELQFCRDESTNCAEHKQRPK